MKYLKYFELLADYEAYKSSSEYVTPNVSYVESESGMLYDPFVDYVDPMANYLTIEALEDGLTASLSTNACEYCVDGDGNWKSLAANTATESINTGQTLSFRGELTPNEYEGIGRFTINKKCNLKGNCMSMLFGDDAPNNFSLSGKSHAFNNLFYDCAIVNVSSNFLPATELAINCYAGMFMNCISLTQAPALPATTLTGGCYIYMFQGCTSLTQAPALPATTLTGGCYQGMFQGCSGLTQAPALPATTLADYCYTEMFQGCTSLTTAPVLPATTLANGCYQLMFLYCSSLTTAPELPATTLADECYMYMFQNCTSLTTAPTLPATTLATNCYNGMFKNCTNLTTAPELPVTELQAPSCYTEMFMNCTSLTQAPALPATTLTGGCYQGMFQGCSNLTTAPELPATTLEPSCYSGMFQGCSNLTTAPELPATTLTDFCYFNMFNGCTNLNHIKMLSTDVSANRCLYNWVTNVAPTGTFVKNPAMTTLTTGTSGIPEGWTVVNEGSDQSPDVSNPDYTFVAPIGASISTENNSKFYTAESWATSGKTLDDVDGIAISNGEYSFMIHPTAESKTLKWGLDNTTVGNDNRASGYYMTNKIAESVNYDSAYAAVYCQDTTFNNGSSGYLMNESEFRMAYEYIDDINACLAAIGGTEFALKGKNYWTCVESGSNMAKYWAYLKADFDKNPKSYKTVWVRPAAPITIV